ncbi:MAG: large subunit of alpha-aminoadipate reductase [Caeruleum heppii]|nr:MAG: large subunit of alpha-aminoadipate reductase [Caeruleum heppii]
MTDIIPSALVGDDPLEANPNLPSTLNILPDPTRDLHWSDFRGAIHDIFHQNALSHPDRSCIVETSGRTFTYQQIDQASNVLAHHLLQHGVQPNEVVMVYAHRGVDLVVAVMGVLKAGATFSVIDPAYPPERQNIYLDVARPRALVVLAKATEEAGEMTPLVRSFIADTLQLRTEVPSLEIQDDGTLLGGTINGKDVLRHATSKQAIYPGVIVGPDSTPTLSFTSGSEGRPKGVKGRHFSLTYYFPWMSQKFHLSEHDRFTMLSGIAHDPIQRDIFTPLFLGARLLVPTKEDIQHEKLAEWMRKYEATVSHLTPAMGQILVGGASAEFPSLHHAFFVGDILIKRDCRSLQRLAPNVNIVNMFGTTETQRSVSYYEIPSRNSNPTFLDQMGDVIPAGKGMLDVQLLVVNRTDREKTCPIGEIGEVYVRAGGLAEGYLGLPDLTKQKFVANWFVNPQRWVDQDKKSLQGRQEEPWRRHYLGPRDRLYRTGDLGRYMESGDVECCGRADDQVKIRGFRIELGEIDTHLSQHPLVRENVTLVRRDKDEEPTLVSYLVPEESKWPQWLEQKGLQDEADDTSMGGMLRRYRALRDDAREHLRKKLPAYAVPTVFVPLRKMPLNPNGKIDKPALPFPDSADLSAAAMWNSSPSNLSDTERAMAEIWGKLIPHVDANGIFATDSFFDLGGHSILAQQMLFAVRRKWKGLDVNMNAIFRKPTLGGFCTEIDRSLNPSAVAVGSDGQDRDRNGVSDQEEDYVGDAQRLSEELPSSFPKELEAYNVKPPRALTVFLTGATGFLGAYVLRDLLARSSPSVNVIAHVRALSPKEAFERVQHTCQAYGVWDPSWISRLKCVTGNLGEPRLGISRAQWELLTDEVDVVIHNGAWVHWVYPYSHLKAANVRGTIDTIKLCATGKAKRYTFVSSTSVLDTDHYVQLSERSIKEGGNGVSEADDLEGSQQGLGTGYGQSKWVSEYIVREAGKRGLNGAIVRPGYVTGESQTGVTNTDDFLIRMIKGCVQLHCRPNIQNTVNMVPVDHVARVVVASAFFPPVSPLGVVHVTSHPRLRLNDFLAIIEEYGYDVPQSGYRAWAEALEEYVSAEGKEQHALTPLYHFATTDLPSDSKAPELDDTNAATALQADALWSGEDVSQGAGVTEAVMGRYLAYLVAIGFMPAPVGKGKKMLTRIELGDEQRNALRRVGGRGALV